MEQDAVQHVKDAHQVRALQEGRQTSGVLTFVVKDAQGTENENWRVKNLQYGNYAISIFTGCLQIQKS